MVTGVQTCALPILISAPARKLKTGDAKHRHAARHGSQSAIKPDHDDRQPHARREGSNAPPTHQQSGLKAAPALSSIQKKSAHSMGKRPASVSVMTAVAADMAATVAGQVPDK